MPAQREIDMSDAQELDERQRHFWEVFRQAKANEEHWKKIKEEAQKELKDEFTHATALIDGRPVFQIVKSYPNRLDQKAVKEQHPEVYQACLVNPEQRAMYPIQADPEATQS